MQRRRPRSSLFPYTTLFRSEFEEGKYVVLSDEDLARAAPEKTQTVDILDFVDAEEISPTFFDKRSEEHTSELQSQSNLVCRLLLEKNKRAKADHSASPDIDH